MSPGYCPTNCFSDWNNTNGRIGFVYQGRVNDSRLNDFINLTSKQQGYGNSKILLGIRSNYIFYFQDNNNSKINIVGWVKGIYGNPSINNLSDINSDSLVNSGTGQITKLAIIVW
jgi:hypothetical protein